VKRRRTVLMYAVATEIGAALTGWTAMTPDQSPVVLGVGVFLLAIFTAVFGAMAGWEAIKP
jgi:uncharacterized membrane protein YgaE (UPF0421/DUF939 family)